MYYYFYVFIYFYVCISMYHLFLCIMLLPRPYMGLEDEIRGLFLIQENFLKWTTSVKISRIVSRQPA